jgi:hypothetical protein
MAMSAKSLSTVSFLLLLALIVTVAGRGGI